MKHIDKTKEQLLKEIDQLRVKIAEQQKSKSKFNQAEEKLNKANRLYATLSHINQAIVRARDKQTLFQEICNIAIEFGKFRFAWIGFVDEESKLVKPTAFSGEGSDYLQNIKISVNDGLTGKGPSGRSIREGKSIVFNDLGNNPDFAPWREQALEKGYRSSASFPIRLNNIVIGALGIYAVETHFFDEDEIKLLEETALDISFALEKFDEEENRKQEEETVIKSEKRYRSLIDALPQYIYHMDKNLRYVTANKAYCEAHSVPQEEIKGKTSKDFFSEKLAEKYMASDRKVIETGKVKEYTEKNKSIGDEDKWVQVVKVPMKDNNGNVDGMLGIYWDISDLRQSEEELAKYGQHLEDLVKERTAELEESQKALSYLLEDMNDARRDVEKTNKKLIEANKELESFSYSVSHDLKAPLRAIDGYTHAVMEDYYEKLDKEGKELLNMIHKNVKNMDQLIKDLLEFSRIGRTVLVISGINMKSLLNDVFMEIYQFIPDRKIQLKIKDFHPVKSDKRLLQQVFLNLMTNAVKFTSNEENAVIEAGSRIENDEIIYYLKDNGIGFDMTYVDKLFGVFQRLHSTEEYVGTGVGLALVQRIINRLGGKVWAEGKVGLGATFYFTLPVRKNI